MTLLIARNVDAKRVFPPITRHLYESSEKGTHTLDQKLATKLLAFSAHLTKWEKYFKRYRNGRDCLNRALFMHRNAYELELGGHFPRADFFWQELYAELTNLFQNDATWRTLAACLASEQPGLEVLGDPAKLRASFIEELLIDTHAAFFNGPAKQTEQLTLESRAWKHFGYLTKVLEWSKWTNEDKFRLIRTAAEAEIHLLEEAKRWKEVSERCQLLISYCPNSIDYEEVLWNANLSQRINYYLTNNYQKHTRVESIEAAIADLKQLQTKYPLSLPLYEKLGSLHYDLAVSLAETGNISSALPAAQKAVTFNPSEHGAALLAELTEAMNNLQEQAREWETIPELRYKHGPFLLDEVRIGFRPLERYRDSDEAKETAEAVRVATALMLWRRIGLCKPPDRWQERAGGLLAAVDSLIEKSPSTANEISQRWHKIAPQDPDLAEVEHDLVCSFLEARILQRAPACVEDQDNQAAYVLETASESQSQQTDTPFYFWLFSRRDLRLKVQASAALILLFGVGAVFVNDSWARSVRSASYQSILQGTNDRNCLQVIEGAERFLSHPSIATNDARAQEVIEHYNKALVLWVARQPGELAPEAAARIERYQQLVGNRNGGSL